MEFFKKRTNFDFLGLRRGAMVLSVILVCLSLGSLLYKGLNLGMDFTGGYSVEASYPEAANLPQIKSSLTQLGIAEAQVIHFGSAKDVRITLKPDQLSVTAPSGQNEQDVLRSKIQTALGSQATISQVSYTGPQVGAELAQQGFLAMLIAIIAIMAYIAFRFEVKFAISAAIALAHDPIIILGIFSWFGLPFDLTVFAAMLAVIGYSLNDTVVIYDRIRENFRKMLDAPVTEVVNRAVNDTLSRTIMTSGLTLLVVTVLFFLGGESIHYFALALIIGVLVGTYSSIYIAGACSVMLGLDREALIPSPKTVDETP